MIWKSSECVLFGHLKPILNSLLRPQQKTKWRRVNLVSVRSVNLLLCLLSLSFIAGFVFIKSCVSATFEASFSFFLHALLFYYYCGICVSDLGLKWVRLSSNWANFFRSDFYTICLKYHRLQPKSDDILSMATSGNSALEFVLKFQSYDDTKWHRKPKCT